MPPGPQRASAWAWREVCCVVLCCVVLCCVVLCCVVLCCAVLCCVVLCCVVLCCVVLCCVVLCCVALCWAGMENLKRGEGPCRVAIASIDLTRRFGEAARLCLPRGTTPTIRDAPTSSIRCSGWWTRYPRRCGCRASDRIPPPYYCEASAGRGRGRRRPPPPGWRCTTPNIATSRR